MKTLSEQILELQEKINARRDLLVTATKALEAEANDENEGAVVEHTAELEKMLARLDTLKNAEKALGTHATPVNAPAVIGKITKANETDNLLGKLALCVYESRVKGLQIENVAASRFGEGDALETLIKAAQNPAMSNVVGYAQELTHIAYGQFMDLLRELAILPRALPLMRQHQFNGAVQIYIPKRAGGYTDAAGAFRAEGSPIPVKGVHFISQILTPKNMGVILSATEEMLSRSSIDLAAFFQNAIGEDTAEVLDAIFVGNTAGTVIQPPGIRFGLGVGDTRPASGAGATVDIVHDVKTMLTAMAVARLGSPNTRWIMSPKNWFTVSMALTALGVAQFPETKDGRLGPFTAYTTTKIPDDIVLLVDFSVFTAGFGAPSFLASNVATIHEDNAPSPISTAGAPNVVAAPVRSLYQTNSWALRMLMDADWALLRSPGGVQELTATAWVG